MIRHGVWRWFNVEQTLPPITRIGKNINILLGAFCDSGNLSILFRICHCLQLFVDYNMSLNSRKGLMKGKMESEIEKLDCELREATYDPEFHGDMLLGDPLQTVTGYWNDISKILVLKNLPQISSLAYKTFTGQGLDVSTYSELFVF